jgi:hypothetical protein
MDSNAGALEPEFNLVTRERHGMDSNAGALEPELNLVTRERHGMDSNAGALEPEFNLVTQSVTDGFQRGSVGTRTNFLAQT